MSVRPILLLEINEIPWRVIDHYSQQKRFPALREFFSKTENYTTETQDEGHLSPWITWPTLHRGIPNTQHAIAYLGQDPTTFVGTPIWEEFRLKGLSIGVFGSLQSWPPRDPGDGGFYVPDTFAADETCIPKWVEPFQKFNLRQTQSSRRGFKSKLISIDSIRLVLSFFRLGIRPSTLAEIVWQLFLERFDSQAAARRQVFQCLISWDIFRKLFNPTSPPAFSSFFTNNIASVIH